MHGVRHHVLLNRVLNVLRCYLDGLPSPRQSWVCFACQNTFLIVIVFVEFRISSFIQQVQIYTASGTKKVSASHLVSRFIEFDNRAYYLV